jgi:hypothetical protein
MKHPREVLLGAQAALTLLGNPNQFLSTVQVGITSIGVLNGIVGEAAFSDGVADWLRQLGASDKAAAISATAIVVTLITFVTIFLVSAVMAFRSTPLFLNKMSNLPLEDSILQTTETAISHEEK